MSVGRLTPFPRRGGLYLASVEFRQKWPQNRDPRGFVEESCHVSRVLNHSSSERHARVESVGGNVKSKTTCVLFLFVAIWAVSNTQAANINVNCNKKETIHKALKLVAAQNPGGPNTITVSGSCKDNLVIDGFDRLTLITKNGASISDPSGGTLAVVFVHDSQSFHLQGFTINGGADGVDCLGASVCYLWSNTIQSSLGQQGVGVGGGSRAILVGNAIQNNTQRGLTVNGGGQVFSNSDTFTGNASAAIVANSGTYFTADISSITNNGADGSAAVVGTDHSALRLISCTISGNKGDGVDVQRGSEARFDAYDGPGAVSANGGAGVMVADLSFALFTGGTTITGNLAGTDVLCSPQFPATRGALANIGGGITNCVEP